MVQAHLAAAIVGAMEGLAILLNVDAVPAYLPESWFPDRPSLTGPPCPLNDHTGQISRQPSMVAGNSQRGQHQAICWLTASRTAWLRFADGFLSSNWDWEMEMLQPLF